MSDHHDAREESPDSDWEALARHLSGESDGAERARIEQLLAADPVGAAMIAALEQALETPVVAELTEADVEAALAMARARRDGIVLPLRRREASWRRGALRAAAVLLVVAGGALLLRSARQSATGTRESAAVSTTEREIATGIGTLDSLRLPDGTRVVLGPRSTLRVSARYADGDRTVRLRGQGYFDVVHDASHPFVVRTATAELRDVGTTFSVESDEGSGARVAVTSGAVAVAGTGAAQGATFLVRAGERAAFTSAATLRIERGATADDLAWLERRLVFHDASISRVAAELRRWYGLELVVADSALAARHVTATFDGDSKGDIGRVLAAVLGAAVQQRQDTLWLQPISAAASTP
jgi:transmembrane sensor